MTILSSWPYILGKNVLTRDPLIRQSVDGGRGNLKTQPRCFIYTEAQRILAKESAPLVAVLDLKVQPTSRIAHIREKVPSSLPPSKPAP